MQMTKPNNEALEAAAEEYSFSKGVAHGNRNEPAWHYSQIDFKAGAHWAVRNDPKVLALVEALKYYSKYIPVHKVITPETVEYEKTVGIGRVATKALEEWEAGK